MVFVNQSGPSAAFTSTGREVARIPFGRAAGTVADVQPTVGATPFVRFGDSVGVAALAATIVLGIASGGRSTVRRRDDVPDGDVELR